MSLPGKPFNEDALGQLLNRGLPRHRPRELFLRGPIPLGWLCMAAKLPGKALAVGLVLWFEAGMKKNARVHLTGNLRDRFNIGRKAGYRALDQLEHAGLVRVDRHRGRCPVVEILDAPANASGLGKKSDETRGNVQR